jgi:hypothetical protein
VTGLEHARRVADAVLYEGYLLYPYTAAAAKNRLRWQFGVLGPPKAAERGDGEPSRLAAQFLLRADPAATLTVHLRALHLRSRDVEAGADGRYAPVGELRAGAQLWTSFDEAAEVEVAVPVTVGALPAGCRAPVAVPGSRDIEPLRDADGAEAGRVVRRREAVTAELSLRAEQVADGVLRVTAEAVNTTAGAPPGRDAAVRHSLLGAHLLLTVDGGGFVSLLDPPAGLGAAAAACSRDRWFPVLAGPEGTDDVLLVSPIILDDHPAVAPESAGPLYDSTEIDEILTLRVLTLSDEEKAAARATDPRAAAIVDRADAMPPEVLARLHGVLREPRAPVEPADGEPPWWDPAVDGAVDPAEAVVVVGGVPVRRGSTVRLRPGRRAGHVLRRPRGDGGRGALRRGRRHARRRRPRRRPCGRPARGVRQVPALRARRTRTRGGRPRMRTVGVITTGLLAAGAVAAALLGVRSLPDVRRYLAMRRM